MQDGILFILYSADVNLAAKHRAIAYHCFKMVFAPGLSVFDGRMPNEYGSGVLMYPITYGVVDCTLRAAGAGGFHYADFFDERVADLIHDLALVFGGGGFPVAAGRILRREHAVLVCPFRDC